MTNYTSGKKRAVWGREVGTDDKLTSEHKKRGDNKRKKENRESDKRRGRGGVMNPKREEMKQERVMRESRMSFRGEINE